MFFEVKSVQNLKYIIQMPAKGNKMITCAEDEKIPVLIYLHGAGGHMTIDRYIQGEKNMFPHEIFCKEEDFPCILILPRMPTDEQGRYLSLDVYRRWSLWSDQIMEILNRTIEEYPVDTDRIYLGGFSMGGFGTWALAVQHPERFAALVPTGGGAVEEVFEQIECLQYTPICVHHGRYDVVVPFSWDEKPVNKLYEVNGNVTFNIHPFGHKEAGFFNKHTFQWLLQQKLSLNIIEKEKGETAGAEIRAREAAAQMGKAARGTPVMGRETTCQVWEDTQVLHTTVLKGGEEAASAAFRVLWDDFGIYILAEVSDKVLSAVSPIHLDQDSVEIFIDFKNSRDRRYNSYCGQYRVSIRNEKTGSMGLDLDQVISYVRQVPGGYILEAAMRWPEDMEVGVGDMIGFDLYVNDDMGNGIREGISTWEDKSGNAWCDPSYFGKILLVDSINDGTMKGNGAFRK